MVFWSLHCWKRLLLLLSIIDLGATNDWISILPEDILVPIVSLLTLREAAQTSILSRPWRFLWTKAVVKMVNLDFYCKDLTGKDKREHYQDSHISLENKRLNFAVWVNHILNIHDGLKINSCRVAYDLGQSYT
ncbi:hypothetical protein LIER_40437 [Lithospermum erythrorhizon]|uniref:F-box domain-containing protein n=1 Tax=Lithospermum erythrorhizon TaxID=34254 RepID=A0AAV3R079_LITER